MKDADRVSFSAGSAAQYMSESAAAPQYEGAPFLSLTAYSGFVPPDTKWPTFGAPGVRRAEATTPSPKVLVTLPARNEAARLIPALRALRDAFDASGFRYQLAIAEDGSTDGTKELLPQLPALFPGIIVQEAPVALGRGKALRMLWSRYTADIYCFTDVDLAAGPEALVRVVRNVAQGQDVVTGSRYTRGSTVERPPLRSLVSLGYNGLTRFAFRESLRDHQCGLKAFSARAIDKLLYRTREDSWFWDTEILVMAHQTGFHVEEVPVDWVEKKARRTELRRLVSDLYLHGVGLLRLKSRFAFRGRGLYRRILRVPTVSTARRSYAIPDSDTGSAPTQE